MKSRIEKYFLGELSGEEMNALEKEALTDPFLADAMEGLELNSNPAIIEELNKQLPSPNTGHTSIWMKGLIAGIVAVGGLILYQFLSPADESITETRVSVGEKIQESSNSMNEETESNLESNTATTYLEEIVVVPETALPSEKFEWKEELVKTEPPQKITPVSVPEEIETGAVETSKSDGLKKLRRSNMVVEYFYDLKVIDYGKIYRTSILVDNSIESGTPANMETHSDAHGVSITFSSEEWVPYMEYLETTMKHIKDEKYARAIGQFKVIFDNFPNDGNAMFYSGLGHYHLGDYNTAIKYFDKIIDHDANTFDEEAKWYKLLSLMHSGQQTLFDELKKEIISENGFYAQKALYLDN